MELVYENGYLYDKDSELLTRVKIKGKPNIDIEFLNKFYNLLGNGMYNKKIRGEDITNSLVSCKMTDLYKYIYNIDKCTKENKQELVNKIISFNNIYGNVCYGEIGELNILTFISYEYIEDCVTVISPYFEYAVNQRYISN